MKIYISGAISKDPDYKKKFAEAEDFLRSLGHVVINPAKNPEGLTYKEYIDLGLHQLSKCDAVYMLEGFRSSNGAIAEWAYANAVGLAINYDSERMRYLLKASAECERLLGRDTAGRKTWTVRMIQKERRTRIPWEAD